MSRRFRLRSRPSRLGSETHRERYRRCRSNGSPCGTGLASGRRLNWTINADAAPDYRAPAGTLIENYRGNPEWRAWLAELRERVTAAIPELIRLVEGRDPWEVFKDRRYLDNTRQTERECPPDGYRFDGQRRANASAQEGACGIKGSRFVSSPSVLRVIAGSSTSLISKTPTAENSAPI